MSAFDRDRRAAGSPQSTGGQFAATRRPESSLELHAAAPAPRSLPSLSDLEARSGAVWETQRRANEQATHHAMALVAAQISEQYPDATEVCASLSYDSDDGATYIGGIDLFRADGSRIDLDFDSESALQQNLASIDLPEFAHRFTDNANANGRQCASDATVGVWDERADEVRIDVQKLCAVSAARIDANPTDLRSDLREPDGHAGQPRRPATGG